MEGNETQTQPASHGDYLTCQKSGPYVQAFRKNVWKTVRSLKFSKSKARNFRWSIVKLKLNLQIMVTDLHAKNQVCMYKRLE